MTGRVVRGLPVAEFAGDGARIAIDYLTEQERMGCIRPEWRYAWIDRGVIGSRVVYWGPPRAASPVVIDAVRSDGTGSIAELLATSLAELAIDHIDYVPDRVAGRSPETEPAELEAAGFALIATQIRLAHAGDVMTPPMPDTIEVRVATDDVLASLIAAVAEHSNDRATRDGDPAAELRGLRRMTHDPASWEVAFDAGRAVGFVMPVRTGDNGSVIGFIGVVPEARGRGIGRFLLARGTAYLRSRFPVRVVADVDDTNVGMLRAAFAVGYTRFAARAHYRR